jgi:hypothetical protein
MGRYLNPTLTVAQAGPVLEQEFRQQFGGLEFEKLYRTLALQAEELTIDEEGQVLGVIALIGKAHDQTNLFLAIVWLAKKEAHDPLVQKMLEITRQKTIQQLLQEARKAVR